MKTFKVSFFGHSYIRDLEKLGNFEVTVDDRFSIECSYFYRPGGTARYFSENKRDLGPLLSSSPDVVVVFLGGNDLRLDWSIYDTISDYKSLISYLSSELPGMPIICSYIEHRFAPANNHFNTPDPIVYKSLARKFNNWLQRWKIPYRKFITWGTNRLENRDLFKRDGVHLNEQGLVLLWDLLEDLSLKVVESLM